MYSILKVRSSWVCSLRWIPNCCGFCLQEPSLPGSHGVNPKKILSCFWQGEGKNNPVKYLFMAHSPRERLPKTYPKRISPSTFLCHWERKRASRKRVVMLKLEKKAQGKHQRDTSWRSQARHTGPLKPWDLTWRVENTSVPHTSLPCQQCSSIIARLQLQELQDTGSLWGGWFREIQNQESRQKQGHERSLQA